MATTLSTLVYRQYIRQARCLLPSSQIHKRHPPTTPVHCTPSQSSPDPRPQAPTTGKEGDGGRREGVKTESRSAQERPGLSRSTQNHSLVYNQFSGIRGGLRGGVWDLVRMCFLQISINCSVTCSISNRHKSENNSCKLPIIF